MLSVLAPADVFSLRYGDFLTVEEGDEVGNSGRR